jgi:hypothetical protein
MKIDMKSFVSYNKSLYAIIFFVFLIFFLPPFFYNKPGTGLDPSWMLAMKEAFLRGMVFGREVIFTYGPLSFLSTRVIDQQVPLFLFVYDLIIASSLAFFFVLFFQKACSKIDMVVFVALALTTKNALISFPSATAFTVFLFWLFYFMESKRSVALVIAGFVGLILFFIKINYGFVTIPVFLLFLASQFFWGQMGLRFAFCSLAVFLVALGIGCFILKVDFYGYLSNGFEIISGYNDNMALPHANNSKPLLNVFVLVFGFAGLLILHFGKLVSGRQKFFYVAATALCLFMLWKNSFTRHSEFYELGFTFCAPLVLAAFYRFTAIVPANQGLGLLVVSLVLPAAILIGGEMTWGRKEIVAQLPINYARQIMESLRATPSHPPDIQKLRKLPTRVSEKLGDSTVEIMPSDISLGYINGLNFTLRPIPQGYSAYTLKLDLKNADFFLSNKAPEFILFIASGLTAIDGKHGFWDESNTKKAILSRYDLVDDFEMILDFWGSGVYQAMERVLVLERRPEALSVKTVMAEMLHIDWNKTIAIPETNALVYLYADIRYSIFGRLLGILHQATGVQVKVEYSNGEEQKYRTSPSMLKTGLLVSKRCDDYQGIKGMFAERGACNLPVKSIKIMTQSPWAFQKEVPARLEYIQIN